MDSSSLLTASRLHAVLRASKLRYSGVAAPGPGERIKSLTCWEFIEISTRLTEVFPVLKEQTLEARAGPPMYLPMDATRTSLLPAVFE